MVDERLELRPWDGPPPCPERLGSRGKVLWLAGDESSPWLSGLKAALIAADRLWSPAWRVVPTSDPLPGRSPWAARPDAESPLRWGNGEGGSSFEPRLAGLPELPAALAGAVFDGVLGGLSAHPQRALCEQVAAILPGGSPYLLLEANGAYLPAVLRQVIPGASADNLHGPRVPTAGEVRRVLELAGLGLACGWKLSLSRTGRFLARGLLGSAAARWMVLEGSRV